MRVRRVAPSSTCFKQLEKHLTSATDCSTRGAQLWATCENKETARRSSRGVEYNKLRDAVLYLGVAPSLRLHDDLVLLHLRLLALVARRARFGHLDVAVVLRVDVVEAELLVLLVVALVVLLREVRVRVGRILRGEERRECASVC